MAKEIAGFVKLQIKGGQTNPAHSCFLTKGINIMDSVKHLTKNKSFRKKLCL